MGHDRECREAMYDIARIFGIDGEREEPYLVYYKVLVASKMLAHTSLSSSESGVVNIARTVLATPLNADPHDEELQSLISTLPNELLESGGS